ncbi:MAG TPA: cytochrome c biogenesis CcdA family protein, partial [Mesotoga sp.]|nr:cytochrome c biogenesis CcdA family protein [Mesotoga sp.]
GVIFASLASADVPRRLASTDWFLNSCLLVSEANVSTMHFLGCSYRRMVDAALMLHFFTKSSFAWKTRIVYNIPGRGKMNELTSVATGTIGLSPLISPIVTTSVTYGSAFLGGLLSFFSPCILPLIPVFFGVLMGGANDAKARFIRGAFFTLGMSIFFFILGIGATGLGTFIRQNEVLMNVISGSLFILFGFLYLFEIGIRGVNLNVWKFGGSAVSGFVLGAVLGLVWVPCAGPILGSILVLAANQSAIAEGGMMLLVYSLGLSIPFLTLSGVVAKLTSKLSFGGESKWRMVIRISVFVVLFAAGLITMTGNLNLLQFVTGG